MPCSQRKARLLLKEGKAKIIGYKPFTIQLLSPTGESTQDVHVGVDTGAKHIGVAVTSEDKVFAKGEVQLREGIHEKMTARSALRNSRRSRNLRYRPDRFLNRKRADNWLPPTIKSKVDATYKWIDKFCRLVPSPTLHIEVANFDLSKIVEQDSLDYQNSYYNKKYYIFARDNYTCQCCKKSNKKLRTHHILYKSKGGSDRIDNLITVCDECHSSENHREGGIFYDWMIKRKKVRPYNDAVFMNIIRKQLIEKYPNAMITYGYETAPYREKLELTKTHYNDAIAITKIESIKENSSEYFFIRQFRKKKRSLHEVRPIANRKTKNVNASRKVKNVPNKAGWYMNDMAICEGKIGWIYGFSGGYSGNDCVLRGIDGKTITNSTRKVNCPNARLSSLQFLCHNNNWQYIVLPC